MSRFTEAMKKTGSTTSNAASIIGALITIVVENELEIERLTDELMKRTTGVDREQAKKIAEALYTQAEDIIWK